MRLVESGVVNLLAPFAVDEFILADSSLDVRDTSRHSVQVDEVVVATGGRPDLSILREGRLDLEPVLEAARRVELDLPQTGVCTGPAAAPTSCCAPSAKQPAAQ